MTLRWMTVAIITALAAGVAACAPSPEQFQPADPLSGLPAVEVRIGGCSPATSPCPQ
jgi:hypothetical protein